MTAVNETPDVVEIFVEKKRISRGVYRAYGVADFKQDITDDLEVESEIMFSVDGRNFLLSPFRAPKTNLSFHLNTYYKPLFMESFRACSNNTPYFKGTFEPPLTARRITIENCPLDTENFPSYLRFGYYRIIVEYSNQARGSMTFETQVGPI